MRWVGGHAFSEGGAGIKRKMHTHLAVGEGGRHQGAHVGKDGGPARIGGGRRRDVVQQLVEAGVQVGVGRGERGREVSPEEGCDRAAELRARPGHFSPSPKGRLTAPLALALRGQPRACARDRSQVQAGVSMCRRPGQALFSGFNTHKTRGENVQRVSRSRRSARVWPGWSSLSLSPPLAYSLAAIGTNVSPGCLLARRGRQARRCLLLSRRLSCCCIRATGCARHHRAVRAQGRPGAFFSFFFFFFVRHHFARPTTCLLSLPVPLKSRPPLHHHRHHPHQNKHA